MVSIIRANFLTFSLNNKSETLSALPIRVVPSESASQAGCSLKKQDFDSVITAWHLRDMPNGGFLRNLKAVRPYIPTIALIRPKDQSAEIAARSIGVSAVLTENTTDEILRETICQILRLEDSIPIERTRFKR